MRKPNEVLERNKQYIRDHISEKMKCDECNQIVDSVWFDGIPSRMPVKHDCHVDYVVILESDSVAGTLFDMEVAT